MNLLSIVAERVVLKFTTPVSEATPSVPDGVKEETVVEDRPGFYVTEDNTASLHKSVKNELVFQEATNDEDLSLADGPTASIAVKAEAVTENEGPAASDACMASDDTYPSASASFVVEEDLTLSALKQEVVEDEPDVGLSRDT